MENAAFRRLRGYKKSRDFLARVSLKHKSKMNGDCCVLKSLRCAQASVYISLQLSLNDIEKGWERAGVDAVSGTKFLTENPFEHFDDI